MTTDIDVIIRVEVHKLVPAISETQLTKLFEYVNLLLYWQQKMNLTGLKDREGILVKNLLDSIIGIKLIPDAPIALIDIGTGAGFPGMALHICRQEIETFLLESNEKKCNFVREVIKELSLTNIKVLNGRAEEWAFRPELREKMDIATSRALAKLATLSELCLPFLKIGGKMIAWKGIGVYEELDKSAKAIEILGGIQTGIIEDILPVVDERRLFIVIEKIRPTTMAYPRRNGMPAKRPIK